MDPTYPLFPIAAFLGFILSLIPVYWQFEAWNVGTVWFIFWIALSCITQYFNSLVWSGNTLNSAPAWCEISIRLVMAASVGLPAASLCINRRLYCIASEPLAAVISQGQKRRAIVIDSFICGLSPVLYTALQIVVQRHRFDILEDIGCTAALYNSLPTSFISSALPMILSVGSGLYFFLCQRAFAASRASLAEGLSEHKNLTATRFMRLSGLAFTVLFFTLPFALLTIATNATASQLSTRVSGDVAPFDFAVIARIPRSLWAADDSNRTAVELTRWLGPAYALVFFAFFGLAEEARANYRRGFSAASIAFWNAAARIGCTRALPPLPGASPRSEFVKLGSLRTKTYAISRPIRPASGTGSFADFTRSPTDDAAADGTVRRTFAPPSPPSASSGRSFIPILGPHPTLPNMFVVPEYQGWHKFSPLDSEVQEEPYARVIEMKFLPPTPLEQSTAPRGRTLV